MINISEVSETNMMIEKENLDVRTITMGISLLDCIDTDLARLKAPEIWSKSEMIFPASTGSPSSIKGSL